MKMTPIEPQAAAINNVHGNSVEAMIATECEGVLVAQYLHPSGFAMKLHRVYGDTFLMQICYPGGSAEIRILESSLAQRAYKTLPQKFVTFSEVFPGDTHKPIQALPIMPPLGMLATATC